MRTIVVIGICAVLLVGCYPLGKNLRTAAQLERNGAAQEALAAYILIETRRPGNADALLGMKSSAQQVFNRLQDEATSGYMRGDFPAGEQSRIDAQAFKDHMLVEGITVEWSSLFELRRSEARNQWIDDLYTQAEAAFRSDRFPEAGSLAARVLQHDPSHTDAEHLRRMARNEPKYRDGKRAFDLGRYTDAFRVLADVVQDDPFYKDAFALHHVALNKAAFTLAYLIVPGTKPGRFSKDKTPKPSNVELLFAGAMEQAIVQLEDPLVKLIDRNHTDALLAEQLKALTGGVEEATAAQAGKLLGAQFVFTGQVIALTDDRIDFRVTLIDASTGLIHLAEQVSALRSEVGRTRDPKPLLMALVAQRGAERLRTFDRFDD